MKGFRSRRQAPRLRRRERRGRGVRGQLMPTSLPAWRSPSERFDDLVLDSIDRLPQRFRSEIERLEFAVEDVPPTDPSPWESGEVPLSRCYPSDRGLPTRIVVYRRPVEARTDRLDRSEFIHGLMVEQVSHAIGVPVEELDPRRDG